MKNVTNEKCGDNRFEIIEKAKQSLLKGTNIESSPEEMKVLDNFLFRCWQMGWLKKYDEQSKESLKEQAKYEIHAQDDCGRKIVYYGDFPHAQTNENGQYYYSTEIKQNGEIVYKLPFKIAKGLCFIADGHMDWECRKEVGV